MEEYKEIFTKKTNVEQDRALFLHLYQWPQNGELTIKKNDSKIINAYMIIGEQLHSLHFDNNNGSTTVKLVPHLNNHYYSLLAFELEKHGA